MTGVVSVPRGGFIERLYQHYRPCSVGCIQITELQIGKCVKGSTHAHLKAYTWRDWGK